MLKNASNPEILRQMLLALLSTSGTLAGISLTLVGIVNFRISTTKITSAADDVFLFSAMGFVSVCYLVFFAIRHLESPKIGLLSAIIDFLFLASLTLIVFAGFITVYAFF